MRIGSFARNNQVSIDTVRHYMSLGLILPSKAHGQYLFDDQCQDQMVEIRTFKQMGFTLSEIKSIFLFNRLGNLTAYQKNEYYRLIFDKRLGVINKEIHDLETYRNNLEVKLEILDNHKDEKNFNLGISFKGLSKLRCLKCQGELNLKQGTIVDNQIIQGQLTCLCGEEYRIDKGILLISQGQVHDGLPSHYDFVEDYVSSTDDKYLENIYRGIDWVIKHIDTSDLSGKTVMELGSGLGFMLRNLYGQLPDDTLYIAIDHDIRRHQFLKMMLEKADVKKDMLFICTDFKEIPLAYESIDYLMDYSGTSNYSFDHESFLLDLVDPYIKKESTLMGTYIMFKQFSQQSMIHEKFRHHFNLNMIQDKISHLGYKPIEDHKSKALDKGGIYEDYFVEGEQVFDYIIYCKRLG